MDWRLMTRKEIAWIVLVLGGVAAALIVYTEFPGTLLGTNLGFGPGWECSNPAARGDVVCFKQTTPKTESTN
jgi:hypothetical protein